MDEPIPIDLYKKFGLVFLAIMVGALVLLFGSIAYENYEREQGRLQEIAEIEAYIEEHSIEQTEVAKLNRLAWLYKFNDPDKINVPRRTEILGAAMLRGDLESQYDLGLLYIEFGEETSGMALIRDASSAGNESATRYLERLSKPPPPPVRRKITEAERIYDLTSNCKFAVERKAPIPDKISFSYTSFSYDDNNIKGDVDFMNQYGAMMPNRFLCNGNDWGEITNVSVYQGYWND